MKKQDVSYTPPIVEVLLIKTEHGFAVSGNEDLHGNDPINWD